MRKLLSCITIGLALLSCSKPTQTANSASNLNIIQDSNSVKEKVEDTPQKTSPNATPRIASLEHLKKWVGKYPTEVNLFKDPAFEYRFSRLATTDATVIEKMDLEEPIKLKNDHYLHIFKADRAGVGEGKASIVIDLKENVIYMAISSGVAPIFKSENDIDSGDGSPFNIDATPVEVMELLNEVN